MRATRFHGRKKSGKGEGGVLEGRVIQIWDLAQPTTPLPGNLGSAQSMCHGG